MTEVKKLHSVMQAEIGCSSSSTSAAKLYKRQDHSKKSGLVAVMSLNESQKESVHPAL